MSTMVLSRDEARRELGVSFPTLDGLIARGEVEVIRHGRRVFIPRASLEHWVRVHSTGGESAAGQEPEAENAPQRRRRVTPRRRPALNAGAE